MYKTKDLKFYCKLFLCNPIDKLKLAWQAKLGEVTIQGINGGVMLTLEDLIPCDDVARLAVDDVNFGDEAVYFLIFIIHTYKVAHKTHIYKIFFYY